MGAGFCGRWGRTKKKNGREEMGRWVTAVSWGREKKISRMGKKKKTKKEKKKINRGNRAMVVG